MVLNLLVYLYIIKTLRIMNTLAIAIVLSSTALVLAGIKLFVTISVSRAAKKEIENNSKKVALKFGS